MGFLGSLIAIVMGGIKSNDVELDHAYLLCASSLVTVSLASFVLGLITAAVIVLSRHCNINPDNVATPIAASLGDITSLVLLSWIATVLYDSIGKNHQRRLFLTAFKCLIYSTSTQLKNSTLY